MFERIVDGRTDLVFDHLANGGAATDADANGVPLIRWCAYYGDVSAIRFLLANGESLTALGDNLALGGAAFHGHWRLCQFLIECGADPDHALPETGETPLHSALCNADRLRYDLVLEVLLAHGVDPNRRTRPGVETESFMRDCRTYGETPLHRAAAFGSERSIRLLLDAGAELDARDMNGDSPLSWASWHARPRPILRLLCHGPHRISPGGDDGLSAFVLGKPHLPERG